MGQFDSALEQINNEIQVINDDIQEEQGEILVKDNIKRLLEIIEQAYYVWAVREETFNKSLLAVYDPNTDTFNSEVEPYFTEPQKTFIRNRFA